MSGKDLTFGLDVLRQETLEYQRTFLAATLENMNAAVVACNEKGELIIFNRLAREWHGVGPLNVPQAQWAKQYDLYLEDGVTAMDINTIPLARAFRGEKIHNIGMVIAAKGQSMRHVLAHAGSIKGEDGRILGAIAVMHDITERKQMEESLIESEKRYRRLMESTTDYIYTVFLVNGHPVNTTHGPGCVAVTGYSSDEYRSDPHLWYRMIHQDDRDKVVDLAQCALKGLTIEPFEHRIYHRDGTIRWLRNTIVVKKDNDGRVVSYDGLVVDITDSKKAQQKLKESAMEWERTFDAIPDLIFIQDKDMNILKVNKACARVLKMSPSNIVGKRCDEIARHLKHDWLIFPFDKTKPGREIHTQQFDDLRSGLSLQVTVSPIFNTEGEFIGAVHVAKDITELKKSEAEKLEHLHELEIFYKGSVGREERILELKEEIAYLKEKLTSSKK